MRTRKRLSVALVAVSAVVGSLITASPALGAPSEDTVPLSADQLLADAGLTPESWEPELTEHAHLDVDSSDTAWEPKEIRNAPFNATQRSASAGPTNVSAGGSGDLPGYTFIEFPFFDVEGRTSVRVNVGSGNLLIQETEIATAGPGVGIEVQRVFNSVPTRFGDISEGWSTSVGNLGLVADPTYDEAWFYGPTGYVAEFTRSGSTWTSPGGLNASLSVESKGTGVVRFDRTGLTYRFVNGWPTSITDRNGVGLTLAHSDRGITSITDATGKKAWLDYDGGAGNAWVGEIGDHAGRGVDYHHDIPGLLDSTTNGVRGEWSVESDLNNRDHPDALERSDGKRVEFEYTDNGFQVTKVTQKAAGLADVVTSFEYTATGTIVTDPLGNKSTYEVDDLNRVTTSKDQLDRLRSQEWTPNSDVANSTDAIGTNVTTNEYDSLNNLAQVSLPTGAAAQAAYAQGANCPNAQAGNPYQAKCTIDPAGNTSSMEYDAVGNLTKQADTTDGATSVHQYEYENSTSALCGGLAGQVCASIDANGNRTSYQYAEGNLIKVHPPAPLGDTTYEYDEISRLTSVTDGNGHTTKYEYDKSDRITATIYNDGSVARTVWNADGTVAGQSDSKVATAQIFQYSLLGKVTSQAVQSSTPGVVPHTATMTHDNAGNVLTVTDVNGTSKYAYDAANQLTSLTEPNGSCPVSGVPAANSGCVFFEYDKNALESKRILPAGANTVTVRDNTGRPTRITAKTNTGATAVDVGYSYAAPGTGKDLLNVQTRTSFKEQGIPAGAITSYAYDSHNRLTLAEEKTGTTASASWAYAYDAAGNRTSQIRAGATGATAGVTTYTYNAAHQLASVTGQSSTFTYDGAGNQTRNGLTGIISAFGDRSQTTDTGSTVQTYMGGGNAGRLTSGSTSFVNTPLGTAQEKTGTTAIQFTYSPKGGAIGYKFTKRSYYVQDILGSVVGIFSSTGSFAGGYSYSPYGEARSTGTAAAVIKNPLRYISGHHEGAGIYKLGARYYDTSLGRFTQTDPSGQEANPYLYASANPINTSDPSGLLGFAEIVRIIELLVLGGDILTLFSPSTDNRGGVVTAFGLGCGAVAGLIAAPTVAGALIAGGGCLVASYMLDGSLAEAGFE